MISLHWHTEPTLLIFFLGAGWLYCLLTGPLRTKIAPQACFSLSQSIYFYAGLILGYITVGSPLDQIGEDFLFAVHMIQHELLIYAIPVLIYMGTPVWLFDLCLKPRFIYHFIDSLTRPLVAGVLFTLCFSIWHVPYLYNAALLSKPIHILEHLTLFVASLIMWRPFFNRSRRLPYSHYGTQMLYIFLLMVGQIPLFAFLTFSDTPFYAPYEYAPRLEFFNITPLQDQILGGIIMKVTNMIVSLTLFSLCFYRWFKTSEAR